MLGSVNSGTTVQVTRLRQGFLGSAGTGSNGDTNRVYTISTTRNITFKEVFLDGVLLTENTHYTADDSAKTITILTGVWDVQNISIFYNVENLLTRNREEFLGSDGTGSTGDSDRVYTLASTEILEIAEVYLDGVLLTETTNYTVDNSAKTVSMVSVAVFDIQRVSVFYNA